MANIIKFDAAHFSFERRCGYNLPLPEMIAQFFQYMRGIGPDAFIIKRYTFTEGKAGLISSEEIVRGCVPTEAYDRKTIRQAQLSLEAELDNQAGEAFKEIKGRTSRVYQHRYRGNDVVYIKCEKGIMGCGWFDSAHAVKKGLKLAGFMLYALGSINGETDGTLLTAAFNYLPYEGEFNSTEADKASEIIVNVLSTQALARNRRGHRFEIVN